MNVVITWMYTSPPGERILHPQVGSESDSRRFQDYYWRCVFLLFESSARMNAQVRHLLFLNREPPAEIDGVRTARLLDQYRIELVPFAAMTRAPAGYHEAWNTQFLVLDILERLREEVAADDAVFLLDSDVLFNQPVTGALIEALRAHRALLYTIDYGASYPINGLSRLELAQIARELDPAFPADTFSYCGGEIVCCLGSELPAIAQLARRAYLASLDRHAAGLKKFNEEAHLLSYVYQALGYRTHTANPFIKRIWTDRNRFCNVDGSERDLVLWHLPAEKTSGFVKAFRSYRKVGEDYRLTAGAPARTYRLEETLVSKAGRLAGRALRRLYGGA
jgi:hypothetical protein